MKLITRLFHKRPDPPMEDMEDIINTERVSEAIKRCAEAIAIKRARMESLSKKSNEQLIMIGMQQLLVTKFPYNESTIDLVNAMQQRIQCP